MWIRTEAFHVAKRGNDESEYEDAFYPSALAREVSAFRCAVADGASESMFSGLWAKLLVRGFFRRQLRMDRLKRIWKRAAHGTGDPASQGGGGKAVPWYVEKKAAHGAHAAFVGLEKIAAQGVIRESETVLLPVTGFGL